MINSTTENHLSNITLVVKKDGEKKTLKSNEKGIVKIEFDYPFVVSCNHSLYNPKIDTVRSDGFIFDLKPKVYRTQEVVKTGSFAPRTSQDIAYNVDVITEEVIEAQFAPTLRELLVNTANLQVGNDNAIGGSSVGINGISGANVKILLDGVPIVGRENNNVNLNTLSMANIESVEIIEGPMSAIYGNNASGGVINLISKNKIENNFRFGGNNYNESVGQYNFNLNGNYTFGDYFVNADYNRNFFSGSNPQNSTNTRSFDWNPKLSQFADFSINHDSEHGGYGIKLNYVNEFILDRKEPLDPYGLFANDVEFITNRYSINPFWKAEFKKNNFLDLSFAYQYYSRERINYIKNLNTLTRTEVFEEGADQFNDFSNIFFRGVFSNDNVYEWLSYQSGIETNFDRLEGTRIEDQGQNIDDLSFFTSAEINLSDKFLLQPMIRAQYNSKYEAPLIPAINAKFKIRKNLDLKGSYSRGFRAPNIKELYLQFIDVSHNVLGNPDLKAENSHHYLASLNFSHSTYGNIFKASIKAFRNEIRNEIFLYTSPPTADEAVPPSTYLNIEQFTSQGGEIGFNYFRDNLTVNLTQVLIGRYRTVTEDFFYTPEFNLNLIYYKEDIGIRAAVLYKYTGRIESFDSNLLSVENLNEGDITPFIVEGFSNLDFTLTKEIKIRDLSFDISGGAKNILNVTNLNTSGSSGGSVHGGAANTVFSWGRTYFLSAKFNIKK